jgi:hypothetical protein
MDAAPVFVSFFFFAAESPLLFLLAVFFFRRCHQEMLALLGSKTMEEQQSFDDVVGVVGFFMADEIWCFLESKLFVVFVVYVYRWLRLPFAVVCFCLFLRIIIKDCAPRASQKKERYI